MPRLDLLRVAEWLGMLWGQSQKGILPNTGRWSPCHYWLAQRRSWEMGYWFLMGISAKGQLSMSVIRKRAGT